MKRTWILDAGHGGIDGNGNYTTAPNKMHRFSDGWTVYEGMLNRHILIKLIEILKQAGVSYDIVSHAWKDISLNDRVKAANAIHRRTKNGVYLSLHSNAGGGSGFEIFTSPGQTMSDVIADVFAREYMRAFPDMKFRSDEADGDYDKEAEFYVLTKTQCPALLVENLFFDNRREAELLSDAAFQRKIADCLFQSIKKTENEISAF